MRRFAFKEFLTRAVEVISTHVEVLVKWMTRQKSKKLGRDWCGKEVPCIQLRRAEIVGPRADGCLALASSCCDSPCRHRRYRIRYAPVLKLVREAQRNPKLGITKQRWPSMEEAECACMSVCTRATRLALRREIPLLLLISCAASTCSKPHLGDREAPRAVRSLPRGRGRVVEERAGG